MELTQPSKSDSETPPKTGRPEKHGFYAKKFPKTYLDHYLAALDDPEMHSLDSEIALLRTLVVRYLDRCHADAEEFDRMTAENNLLPLDRRQAIPRPPGPDLDTVARACESIGRNIERLMGKRYVLTVKGADAFARNLAKVVFDEIGKKDPETALRIVERVRAMGPAKGDTVQEKKGA